MNSSHPLSLPRLPHIGHAAQAQDDLEQRGQRCCEADMEKRDRCLPAHEIGHGHADAEGADDALDHDKAGHAEAVVEADEAEENGCQEAVNGVGLEVIRCG